MVFPYDFGFVPGTKTEDGDPLDVLVLTDEALFPGCRLFPDRSNRSRTTRGTGRNKAQRPLDRSGISVVSLFRHQGPREPEPDRAHRVEAFLVNYQKVRDIRVTILGRQGPDKAQQVLRRTR